MALQVGTPSNYGFRGASGSSPQIAPVGGNDTAGQQGVSFNAQPDYQLIRSKERNDNSFYPHIPRDNVNRMDAHKGLLGFRVIDPVGLTDDRSYNGWSMDRDQVKYIDTVNGMLKKGADPSQIIRLAERIQVMGVIEEDIKAEPLREAGSPLSNNLIASGKRTMPNTGSLTINAGEKIMWALPSVQNGKIKGASTDIISTIENGLAPLVTMPYVPTAHKGSPEMLYQALMNDGTRDLPQMHSFDSSATVQDAQTVVESLKTVVLIGLKTLQPNMTTAQLQDLIDQLEFGKSTGSFTSSFYSKLMRPTENFVFENSKPTLSEIQHMQTARHTERRTTGTRTGSSLRKGPIRAPTARMSNKELEMDVNMMQLRAFSDLYRGIASVETRFRERVIGMAYTSASPGRDMDVLLHMSGNGSL